MSTQERTISSKDGLKLYVKDWMVQQPRAVIMLMHGFGEHIQRYEHLAVFFVENGFAVMGMDWRGHGRSEGQRGHTPHFEAYLQDADLLLEQVQKIYPKKAVFLWGHSMGGNLTLNYMLRRKPDVKGTIVTGAWIRLAFEPKPIMLTLGRWMRNIYPSFSQSANLKTEHICTDSKVVNAYNNDPLVHGKITAAAGMELTEAAAWLNTYQGAVHVPTLIMHGEKDMIISPAAAKEFSERVKGKISFKLWSNLYHEIHNEPNQQEILKYALDWMNFVNQI